MPRAKQALSPNRHPLLYQKGKKTHRGATPEVPRRPKAKRAGDKSGLSAKVWEVLARVKLERAARDAFIAGVDTRGMGPFVVLGPKRAKAVNFREYQGTYDAGPEPEREDGPEPEQEKRPQPPRLKSVARNRLAAKTVRREDPDKHVCPKPFVWRGNTRCGCNDK